MPSSRRESKRYVRLPARAVLVLDGEDARSFLQGLITGDMERLTPVNAIHAALLTPQGKYLHDFFLAERDGRILVDTAAETVGDLVKRLTMYRLRAKVGIADESAGFSVVSLPDDATGDDGEEAGKCAPGLGGIVFVDPRLPALGRRAILPADGAAAALSAEGYVEAPFEDYEALRVRLGVPDGPRDLLFEKSLLLEFGFQDLNGVSFDKGCFVGQEVTTRMQHRGLVRKRLMPVEIDGPEPVPGTPVMAGDVEAGEIRTAANGTALACLRLDLAAKGGLTAGGVAIVPHKPDWASF